MSVTLVNWGRMTDPQKEYVVYLFAGRYISEVLKWDRDMPEITQRLKELQSAWDDPHMNWAKEFSCTTETLPDVSP